METYNFVCIECPRGCDLTVVKDGENVQVSGNFCPKGKKYATDEVTEPRRIVTGSVRGEFGMISVKTNGSVKKSEIFSVMEKIKKVKVFTNLKIGDIIISNIDGEGTDLIATRPYENIAKED